MVSKIGLNTGGSSYTSCRSYRRHFYLKTANRNRLFSIDEGLKKEQTTYSIIHLLQIKYILNAMS